MQQAAAFIPRGWHVLPKQENNAIQRETENVGTALLSNLTQLRILDAAARSIINTVLMGTIGGGIAVACYTALVFTIHRLALAVGASS